MNEIPTAFASYCKFDMCGDPELIKMVSAVNDLQREMIPVEQKPRWLTILGTTGTGKTYLCRKAQEAIFKRLTVAKKAKHQFSNADVEMHDWPTLVDRFRDGEYYMTEHLIGLDCLTIDDIGAEMATPLGLEKLFRIMNGRVGKWTILTSNLSQKRIREIDPRFDSRLTRDGSVLIEVVTDDYCRRPAPVKTPALATNRP